MVDRIRNILLTPKPEWDRIDAEPATEKGIMTGWVLPLAAIGPVAGLIGGQVFGMGAFGIHWKLPIGVAIGGAVLGYILAVVNVWILAKVIDALAPSFGGTKNPVQAMKVAAYSMTASFVAGIFQIFPPLAFLSLLGLYGFYLLWLGEPKLMRAPEDKAVGYVVVTVVVAIVLYLVIGAISGAVMAQFLTPASMGITLPTAP